MKTITSNIARLLYYLWFSVPYLLFVAISVSVLATELVLGGISWNNDVYEAFFPIVFLLVPAFLGLLALPFISIYVLLFGRRYSRYLLQASAGYILYLLLMVVAIHNGWWVD